MSAIHGENGYAVVARPKIGQDKYGAILSLTGFPKCPEEKCSAGGRVRSIGDEQKGRANRRRCARQCRLVFLDCGFDSRKIGGHGGNGVLPQSSHIGTLRHFKIAFRSGFERGSRGGVHIRGGLAGLGVGRSSEQGPQQQERQPQPPSAAPSVPKRGFRSSYQRESLRRHSTRRQTRNQDKALPN